MDAQKIGERSMQYLNDAEGKPLGVFLSMPEWEKVRAVLPTDAVALDGDYETWFRLQVEAGLKEAEEGRLLPFARTVEKLKARGFDVH